MESEGILFLGLSDMDAIARIDAYISNLSLFKKANRKILLGSIACYKILSKEGKWSFKHLWSKSYSGRINGIDYNPASKLLLAAASSGHVHGLDVDLKNIEENPNEALSIEVHKDGVTAVAVNERLSQFYSIGSDKRVKATEIFSQLTHWQSEVDNSQLASMKYDEKSERLFVLSSIGTFVIYSVTERTPVLAEKFTLGIKETFIDMLLDAYQEFIIACNS
eukprot:TRINITY_DN9197_c0_g4_i5.p2 TRINITY_DN9197_c0_g4~~TRINITY_DN9197_c0_g4_i5.p2  ORF type:complete len:221 (-),score=35.24 TRINITY_DN9197_c0_g4_i5:3321-3983(-)